MIYSLRGKIVHYDAAGFAIECGGVAYYCQASLSTITQIADIGDEILVYTHMNVRENAVDLFGFADKEELSCYKMVTSVSGVGPKAALAILSQMSPERFALCVASGDYKSITVAQGVGTKIAQRIVLELKDKVNNSIVAQGVTQGYAGPAVAAGGNMAEAVNALLVLGYSQAEAASAVGYLPGDLSVEEMIKAGLKTLASGR